MCPVNKVNRLDRNVGTQMHPSAFKMQLAIQRGNSRFLFPAPFTLGSKNPLISYSIRLASTAFFSHVGEFYSSKVKKYIHDCF